MSMASTLPLAASLLSSLASSYSNAPQAQAPQQPSNPFTILKPAMNMLLQSGSQPNSSSSQPASTPPITTSGNALCDHCHMRPRFEEPGKKHMYCGRTCADAAASTNSNSSSGNCESCKKRPKFYDNKLGKLHPYCSKSCAGNLAKKRTSSTSSTVGSGNVPVSNNQGQLCKIPGCQKPRFTNPDGTLSGYCSFPHKTLGENACLMCRAVQKTKDSHFCSTKCADDAEALGPMLLKVPSGHATFKSVADQFKASWRHSTAAPPVRRVYKIVPTKANATSYTAYKAKVEANGHHVAAGRQAGNEHRRWHGTRRECNLGDKGHENFCTSATCSLCCIVKTSFDLSAFGKKTGWGRFGRGIYTSSTSSKSNDYSQNVGSSKFKAILLNKVVVGRGCKMTQDNPGLQAPPTGFDSVLAEKGGSLNYDELVVYTDDAIRPSFLVIYEP